MIRTLVDRDAVNSEDIILTGGLKTWAGLQTKGIVVCHGSGATAANTMFELNVMLSKLSPHASLHIGDLGFQTWGNDIVIDRIDDAVDKLASIGVTGKIALLGVSMGGCSALNYAHAFPDKVAAIAAMIPLVDLDDAMENPWLTGRWPEIEAIYGDPPDFTGHNPVEFAATLPSDMPIHIWSSSDDGLARRPTHEAFIAARPQTGFTEMGAVGHSVPDVWSPSLLSFFARNFLAN